MKYINKSTNAEKGYQIINDLRREAWNEEKGCLIGFDYNGLSADPFRSNFKQLTLQEQDNCCCYCMKKIKQGDSNLEHIIPHKVSQNDFHKYLIVKELKDNVHHKDEFDLQKKWNKYPHDIAYHNLISSCLSKLNCNEKRGSKYIEPITYDKDISDKVVYEKDGSIFFEAECDYLKDVFLKLGLDNHLLKKIRRVWYLLAQRFETVPYPINLNDSIYDVIALDENMENLIDLTMSGNDMNIASKAFPHYEWFFYYYKNKYP